MFRICLGTVVALLVLVPLSDAQDDRPARFAQNARYQSLDLSPDGERIAYILHDEMGTGSVVIAASTSPDEMLDELQFGTSTMPLQVVWLDNDALYLTMSLLQERDGEFHHREIRVIRRLSDGQMVRAASDMDVVSTATGHAGEVLFAQFLPRGARIFELNLRTFQFDQHSYVTSNDGPPASFIIGPTGTRALTLIGERGLFRLSSAMTDLPRGIIHRETRTIDREARFARNNWSRWSGVVGQLEGLHPNGDLAVFSTTLEAPESTRRPGGRSALYTIDVRSGQIAGPVMESGDSDILGVIRDWRNNAVIGALRGGARTSAVYISAEFLDLQARFEAQHPDLRVSLLDWNEHLSIVLYQVEMPGQPPELFLYFEEDETFRTLGSRYPEVGYRDDIELETVAYLTGDGMNQFAYLTIPTLARPDSPAPLVIMPHGGPQTRDYDRYDPMVQILTRSGYAVLQPQFRGSRGFGLEFMDAGEEEWAGLMQSDIYDALDAARDDPRIDAHRACIVGWSYGGYAALTSAVDGSDRFACTISIAGVSDIRELMENETRNSVWRQQLYWSRVIGNWNHWGREARVLSPALRAENLDRPLLLMHGSLDAIVPVDQSEIFQDAANEAGQGDLVRSVYFDNARHAYLSFTTTDRERLLREMVDFLGTHLPVVEAPASTFPVETSPPAEGG